MASQSSSIPHQQPLSDIEVLPICSCPNINSNPSYYRDKLTLKNAYNQFHPDYQRCSQNRDDHFKVIEKCELTQKIDDAATTILLESAEIEYKQSAVTLISAFQRKNDTNDDESDLAGDGGKLAFLALTSLYPTNLTSTFSYVVDIGGQDTEFVNKFPNAQKFILDINKLAPFLKPNTHHINLKYCIGDAYEFLVDDQFLAERTTADKSLFAMSNFINVLSPEIGMKILLQTYCKMRTKDILVITNLFDDQFKRPKHFTNLTDNLLGIKQIYRQKTQNTPVEAYKSTIGTQFLELIEQVTQIAKNFFPNQQSRSLEIKHFALNTLNCKVNPNTKPPIKFLTIIFEKI